MAPPDDRDGLTDDQVAARRRAVGPNRMPAPPRRSARALLAPFTHLMALLLWAGGAIAFVAGMPPLGIAIWLVNLGNGLFAAWQEHRAERAAAALRGLLPPRARVVRAGVERVVDAADLVPGDLLLVSEGDRVSADARLVAAAALEVTEAALTGESVSVAKTADATTGDAHHVFAGTMVVRGWGRAIVTATGGATRVGAIARTTVAVRSPPSPLERELRRLTRAITFSALGVGLAFFVIATIVTDLPRTSALLFALGMVVAFVPEGLLPTVTVALARSTRRMAARNALVRRPSAVETLGATSVICCDKTGTLTEGEMQVVELVLAGASVPPGAAPPPAAARAARVMALCHDLHALAGGGLAGDSTERALVAAAPSYGPVAPAPRTGGVPFDYRRRRMTTLHTIAGRTVALCKGAPADVLACCRDQLTAGGPVPLDDATRAALRATADALAARGLRVLALADRDDPAPDPERELTFLGLVALRDPPRPEVPAAVARCRAAGIRVMMMTGDHPQAARAISRELGLVGAAAHVITGDDLERMDDAALAARLRGDAVFARVRPEHKLRITAALQSLGEVVAVTGDGTNDAPALQRADVGVAMGRGGTDLAREAADVILLDDNFASIVAAIEEGRTVYANIKRFTSYIFTSNVPEAVPFIAFALSGGRVPLALAVMHVLAIDLGTDMAPALALGAEPPDPDVMTRPPRRTGDPIVTRALLVRAYLGLGVLQAAAVMLAFLLHFHWHGHAWPALPSSGPVYQSATGFALAAVAATQIGNLFAHRGRGTNHLVLPAIAIELAVLLAILHLPSLATAIGTAPFPAWQWLTLLPLVPLLPLATRTASLLRRALNRPTGGGSRTASSTSATRGAPRRRPSRIAARSRLDSGRSA